MYVRESMSLALALLHHRYSLPPILGKYISPPAKPCTLYTTAMYLQNQSIYSSSSSSSSGYQRIRLANSSKYHHNHGRCPKVGRLPFSEPNSRGAQVFRLRQPIRHMFNQIIPRLRLDPLYSNYNVPTLLVRHLLIIPERHRTMRLSPTRTKRNLCLTIIRIKS